MPELNIDIDQDKISQLIADNIGCEDELPGGEMPAWTESPEAAPEDDR